MFRGVQFKYGFYEVPGFLRQVLYRSKVSYTIYLFLYSIIFQWTYIILLFVTWITNVSVSRPEVLRSSGVWFPVLPRLRHH